jgi:hypothetical protein
MNNASLPIRLLAGLLVLTLLAWRELSRLRRLLADAVAPGRLQTDAWRDSVGRDSQRSAAA